MSLPAFAFGDLLLDMQTKYQEIYVPFSKATENHIAIILNSYHKNTKVKFFIFSLA